MRRSRQVFEGIKQEVRVRSKTSIAWALSDEGETNHLYVPTRS